MPQNKRIAFGVNLFGSSIRTDLSIESYLKIKKKYPDNVDLFNVQFIDESVKYRAHPEFKLLRALEQSNQDYIKSPSKKTIPMSQEVMDRLSELNYKLLVCEETREELEKIKAGGNMSEVKMSKKQLKKAQKKLEKAI